jgi:hypothetical protein
VANPNPEPHLENLKPFQPGQSGNPAGSSRKARLTARLKELLDDEEFLKVGIAQAMDGNFLFWRHIFDRVDGQVPKPEESATELEDLNEVIEEAQAEYDRAQEAERKADKVP